MADDRAAALTEAYNRGILPPHMKTAYEEAQKRGIVAGAEERPPAAVEEPDPGGIPGAAAVNFLDMPVRDFFARIMTWNLPDADKYRAEMLEKLKVPETGVDKQITKVLDIPGQIIGKTAEWVGEKVLGKETADKVGPYAGIAGDVAGMAGMFRAPSRAARGTPYKEAATSLREAGIDLTPGQRLGKAAKSVEAMGESVPFLGLAMRAARIRTIEDFDRATINRSLSHIGEELPKTSKPGHDSVKEAGSLIGKEYDRLHRNMSFQADQQFITDFSQLDQYVRSLAPAQREQFTNIVKDQVARKMSPAGSMPGKSVQQVRSELRERGRGYNSSSLQSERELGTALGQLNTLIGENLERVNPAYAQALADADAAYAMLVRIENAASRRPTSMGVFTPSDLLQATKTADSSVRKRAFARGDALLQNWGEAGQRVLPSDIPTSGTVERAATIGATTAAVAAPHTALAAAPYLAAGALPYTTAGMWLGNRMPDGMTTQLAIPAVTPRPDEEASEQAQDSISRAARGSNPLAAPP